MSLDNEKNSQLEKLKEENQILKNQLKEHSRELQIEAAVERVRVQAMSMQSSNDFSHVMRKIWDEIGDLSIEGFSGTSVLLFDEENTYMYDFSSIGNIGDPSEKVVNYLHKKKKVMQEPWEMWKKKVQYHEMHMDYTDPKDVKSVDDEWKDIDTSIHHNFLSAIESGELKEQWNTFGYFPQGYISFDFLTKPDEHAKQITIKMANAMALAFKRYEDLQIAETQTREAQIEAALERVRSRTMAMQHSNELAEASHLLDKEVRNLGIKTWGCAFNIYREKDSIEWFGNEKGVLPTYTIPRKGIFKKYFDAGQKGKSFHVQEFKGQKCIDHYEYMSTLPVIGDVLRQLKKTNGSFPEYQIDHVAFFKYGYLLFITIEKVPEAHDIFKRFASLFEQTYTRFLDLQKAEAQAREAQIEASLESVRARSMAMYHSDELGEVITLIFEKLGSLDISVGDGVALITFSEGSKDLNEWMITKGLGKAMNFHLPYFDHPVLSNLWEAKNRGEEQFSYTYSKKESKSFLKYIFEQTDFIHTPEDVKEYCLAAESYTTTFAFQKHTAIFINDYLGGSLTESELAILERFSKVFEQTYTRFLDLQKAESQARSAQIEAAVERVRSEAMAMHHPSDLVNVTQILIKEITNIGIQGITGAAFILVDEDDIVTMWDISDPGNMGYTRDNKSVYDPREFKMLGEFWRKWKKGDEYFVIKYDLEKNKKGLEEWKLVDEENYESLKRAIEQNKLKTQWNPFGSFSKGLLTLDMMTEPDADTEKIVVKMARTFDLAYQRFDDLQKAEEQAREAKEQASLDRIRAEIGSMRNQKDLETITPLIWSELSALGVPFFRCGVFIIDQAIQKVQLYLSTPNGKSIAAITMDFNSNEVADDVVANWRKQSIYKDEWDREEFIAWSKDLLEQGLIPNVKEYQHDETPPERLFLQFVPFKQGMLYIGTDHFLSEDHMELIQDIADDFSIAYSRYEDFMSLEKAKHMAENALGELRSTQTQLVHAEKMASLGELTAGIAHEIQNPLNFVNNFSDLNRELIDELSEALESGDMEEVKELLVDLKANEQKIIHHGKRAEDIVRGMLQHSRTGDGKKELTNLNALADEYLRLSYHGLRAKDKSFNADFKCTLDKTLPKVNVVPQDLGRVILNLINNAFHAVSQKSKASDNDYSPIVEVLTINKNDGIDLIVKDNGAGISDNIKVKIFQPFFTTKATGEGTGLGLSLSYDIITKGHGGSIKVESKEGEGSEFIINLPII